MVYEKSTLTDFMFFNYQLLSKSEKFFGFFGKVFPSKKSFSNVKMLGHLIDIEKARALSKLKEGWLLRRLAGDLHVIHSCISKLWEQSYTFER